LSSIEKWEWHADVYAFRRVYLGVYDTTSPCDEKGVWYDPNLVEAAEHKKRAKQGMQPPTSDEDREVWARSLGWSSWLERQDAIARNEERYAAGLKWQRGHAAELKTAQGRRPSPAEALGVTAAEYKPTPEQMASARRELGLEQEDPNAKPHT
jgi:hypothetical protein